MLNYNEVWVQRSVLVEMSDAASFWKLHSCEESAPVLNRHRIAGLHVWWINYELIYFTELIQANNTDILINQNFDAVFTKLETLIAVKLT